MKKLVFVNGTKAYFTDESTIYNCIEVVSKFAEVDDLAG